MRLTKHSGWAGLSPGALHLGSFLLAWLAAGAARAYRPPSDNCPNPACVTAAAPCYVECAPGPWGELFYQAILIEPPEERLPAMRQIATDVQWVFEGPTDPPLPEFLLRAGLDQAQRDDLMKTAVPTAAGGTILRPDDRLIESMDPQARAAVYAQLSRWPTNAYQSRPFRFRPAAVDAWLGQTGLSADTLSRLRRLLYPHGDFMLFSDPQILFRTLPGNEEKKRLFRVLYRQQALLAKLHVHAGSDVGGLVKYWGEGGREEQVRPLLESLARAGGGDVGVELLLPHQVREWLYTYRRDTNAVFRDCFWTSLNFFEDELDDRFGDSAFRNQYIQTHYEPAGGTPRLGDVVYFRRAGDGQVIHSCNLIADRIVLTKNGGNILKPWVLTDLQEVLDYYALRGPIQMEIMRLKR